MAQHRDLVAQDQNLDALGGGAAGEQPEPAGRRDRDQIGVSQVKGRVIEAVPPLPSSTVNLLRLFGDTGMVGSGGSVCEAMSGRRGRAGALVPGGEFGRHFASVFLGAKSMTARSEVR
jgi:hypothetical protein